MGYLNDIHATSNRKDLLPIIGKKIENICKEIMDRLNEQYSLRQEKITK